MRNAKTGYDYANAPMGMLEELIAHCLSGTAHNDFDVANLRTELPKLRAGLAKKQEKRSGVVHIAANVPVRGHDLAVALVGKMDPEGFFVGSGPVYRDGETIGGLSWDGEGFLEDGLLLVPGDTDDTIDAYAALHAAVREQVRRETSAKLEETAE